MSDQALYTITSKYRDITVKDCIIQTKGMTLASITSLVEGSIVKYDNDKATGIANFSFTAASAGNNIPAGTIVIAIDGTQFTTDVVWTAVGAETSADVAITAIKSGTSGNQDISTITSIGSLIPTLSSVTVDNSAITSGGTEEAMDISVFVAATDDINDVCGILLDSREATPIGDYALNVIVKGTVNLERVQETLGSIPSDAIVKQLETKGIYLSGGNQ